MFLAAFTSLFNGGDQSQVSDDLLMVSHMYAFIIPFYLLGRMSGNLLQVVRKSTVCAIVFTCLGLLRIVMFSLWGNNTGEVAMLEVIANVLTGLIMIGMLACYVKKFDPDEVDEKSRRRNNVFSILREKRAAAE